MSGVIGISSAEQGRFTLFYASLACLERSEDVNLVFSRGAEISGNRNKITEVMLETGADWVLYLDDDHVLQPHTLNRLLASGKDVISAHYNYRQYPFNSVLMANELDDGAFIMKQLHPQESGVVPVAAAGAGCLLVTRKVIEALEPPYWTLGQINPATWGDDLHFCSRVRKAGFQIFCDLNNPIGHIMTGIVWPSRTDEKGWMANFCQDVGKETIAKWPMPMPGDF